MRLSKPAILVIDLVALVLILKGWAAEPKQFGLMLVGIILFGLGVYAATKRYKENR